MATPSADSMSASVRRHISGLVSAALDAAQASGDLPQAQVADLSIERPRAADNGDYSCSLAMKLARPMRMNPRAIGEAIVAALPASEIVGRVWVAGPGFINFALDERWLRSQVNHVIRLGETFGNSPIGGGQSVQVEFVSVNPTGPVHVGHARGAVLGSALANALEAAGYDVQREYYVNDAGTQMELFYQTAYARYLQQCGRDAPIPEDGYRGEYMNDLARAIRDRHGEKYADMDPERATAAIGEIALESMVDSIRQSLDRLGVGYDVWFRERSLYTGGGFDNVMSLIDKRGYRAERDGAVWFAATELGAENDAVLIRSNGAPTYFASDVAYHHNKFIERGFRRVVDIWGADHQGHVNRMKAAVSAMDVNPDRLTLMIYQMVTLKQRLPVACGLSKRTGEFITVAGACRGGRPRPLPLLLPGARRRRARWSLTWSLPKSQSAENPVYYVQYAHARICQHPAPGAKERQHRL